jgi:septal ring factor EnvC (AmiA/AmiB activator)
MAINPPTINDFKKNAERQTREQRSTGSLLSILVWTVLAGLLLVAGLAVYGGYVLSSQIKDQALTVQQLQSKTDSEIADLRDDLNRTRTALADVVNAVNKQQDRINKLAQSNEEAQATIRSERALRQTMERRLRAVETAQANVVPR